MKKLTIKIHDDVYEKIKTKIQIIRAVGNFHGIMDEFIAIIVGAIEKGEPEVTINAMNPKECKLKGE